MVISIGDVRRRGVGIVGERESAAQVIVHRYQLAAGRRRDVFRLDDLLDLLTAGAAVAGEEGRFRHFHRLRRRSHLFDPDCPDTASPTISTMSSLKTWLFSRQTL